AQARTATAALAENSKNSAVMLAVIEELGVAPRDMQTSGLSLSALWNNRSSGSNERPDIVGYSANSQVTIRVRDLNNLGSILDSVVKSGANGFNGLQFGLQDPVPAQDNARAAAVADAKRKAELYAKAAGISLGPIHTLSEAGSSSPQPVMLREMAMSDAVPIAQGEVSMRASVTIVYEILQ
ncbi:MAG: SIMPL domain-containing protein, partial [Paracoccaceae bacterium]